MNIAVVGYKGGKVKDGLSLCRPAFLIWPKNLKLSSHLMIYVVSLCIFS